LLLTQALEPLDCRRSLLWGSLCERCYVWRPNTILPVVGHGSESLTNQYPAVLRFLRRRVPSLDEAEDLTQEAFTSAIETLARSARNSEPTIGWLYTVARRRLVDEARRRRVETVPLEVVPSTASAGDDYGGLVADALDGALSKLTAPERSVIVLRLLEGRSFAEVGAQLGLTEPACRMRFMRALKRLRAEFEKEGLAP
jgi:RNA polymerase sigma-70 factor, ECF subfamily